MATVVNEMIPQCSLLNISIIKNCNEVVKKYVNKKDYHFYFKLPWL